MLPKISLTEQVAVHIDQVDADCVEWADAGLSCSTSRIGDCHGHGRSCSLRSALRSATTWPGTSGGCEPAVMHQRVMHGQHVSVLC